MHNAPAIKPQKCTKGVFMKALPAVTSAEFVISHVTNIWEFLSRIPRHLCKIATLYTILNPQIYDRVSFRLCTLIYPYIIRESYCLCDPHDFPGNQLSVVNKDTWFS